MRHNAVLFSDYRSTYNSKRHTAMGVEELSKRQSDEWTKPRSLHLHTLGLVGTMPSPPVFLCSPLPLPAATLTPTPFPPSAFLSLPQLPKNLHWAQRSELRTVFCRCSKPPGPLLICFLCQPVPFVASTSTYPGPTPSLYHGLYLCLEFPFPNCVLRNAYLSGCLL